MSPTERMKDTSNTTPPPPPSEADFELDLDQIFSRSKKPGEGSVVSEPKSTPPAAPQITPPAPTPPETPEYNSEPEIFEKGKGKLQRKNNDQTRTFTRLITRPSTTVAARTPIPLNQPLDEQPADPEASLYGKKKHIDRLPELTPNKAHALLDQAFTHTPARGLDPHRLAKFLKFSLYIALLVAVGWLLFKVIQLESGVTARPNTNPIASEPLEKRISQAKATMQQYLDATTWDAKLNLILEPDRLRTQVKEYYTTLNGKDPSVVTIQSQQPIQIGSRYWFIFNLKESGTNREVQMKLQETPTGYKIDWENLVGLGALPWAHFFVERPTEPKQMRVTLEASNDYSGTYADQQKYRAYTISHQSGPPVLTAYVDASSRAAQALLKLTSSGTTKATANLYLQFEPDSEATHVKIVDLAPESQF